MSRSSIEDVAKLAGVSITTVSRVMNDKGYPVSEKARKSVLQAVKQLGYFPNVAAQNLRNNVSKVIGLITREIADPYFGIIARAVTERANYYGVLSFVCNTGRNPVNEIQYHDLLWQHKVRGIILSGGGLQTDEYQTILSKQLQRYSQQGNRIVALAPQGIEMPYVMIDNRATCEMITDHLIDRGHRRIAFIGGPENVFTSIERLEGYKLSLQKHGLAFDVSLVSHGDFSWEGGYEATRRIVQGNYGVSGLCCANDDIAFGAMHALKNEGICVPQEVSVISIGDLPMAGHASPPLTTAHLPLLEMGTKAVDVLMSEHLQDEKTNIIFRTSIVERHSTMPHDATKERIS